MLFRSKTIENATKHKNIREKKQEKASDRKGLVKINNSKVRMWSLWTTLAIWKRRQETDEPLWKIGWYFNLQGSKGTSLEKVDVATKSSLNADVSRRLKQLEKVAEAAANRIFPVR